MSNTQKDNANTIFTSEKLDKSDGLVDAVKNLTINDSEYYQSNKVTASDTQGDITHNPETITGTRNRNDTVTHTRNGNETFIHTRNGYFEKQLLSNRTIPVVVLMMNQKIEQIIAPIVLALQMILTQYHTWTEILLAQNHYTPRD